MNAIAEKIGSQLRERMAEAVTTSIQTFREIVLRNHNKPLASWPAKDVQKLTAACEQLQLSPELAEKIIGQVVRIEQNRGILDNRAEEAKRHNEAAATAKAELVAAEQALLAAKQKHGAACAEEQVARDTWLQLTHLVKQTWLVYRDIDQAAESVVQFQQQHRPGIKTFEEATPARNPFVRG